MLCNLKVMLQALLINLSREVRTEVLIDVWFKLL